MELLNQLNGPLKEIRSHRILTLKMSGPVGGITLAYFQLLLRILPFRFQLNFQIQELQLEPNLTQEHRKAST